MESSQHSQEFSLSSTKKPNHYSKCLKEHERSSGAIRARRCSRISRKTLSPYPYWYVLHLTPLSSFIWWCPTRRWAQSSSTRTVRSNIPCISQAKLYNQLKNTTKSLRSWCSALYSRAEDFDVTFKVLIVRYSSVSLSSTLSKNEKIEQHIRKKTYKPNVLRFWVKGGVIFLCGSSSCLILV